MSSPRFQTSKSLYQTIKPWIQLTRVSKFAGTMVLFWPYAWSFTMAARVLQLELSVFVSFLIFGFFGSSLLHSAGCVWNDIIDRDFDRQVERTKNRPLAAGTISVFNAVLFLFVHLTVLINMLWNTNAVAFGWGLISVLILPAVYPFMKRITYWPQAWLGLAMNCGVPMAWLILGQGAPTSVMILYGGTWAWTMWYDTIYACQDKRDDVKVGVKSTALLFGTRIKPILLGFASVLIGSLFISGVMNNMGRCYYLISVFGGTIYLAHEMYTVDLNSPQACWDSFHRNGFIFGGIIWAGALAGYIISVYT